MGPEATVLYLTNLTIYQRVLLAEEREGMLVGGGRGKGQFQLSLKAAIPRMKVLQRTVSGRTASEPQWREAWPKQANPAVSRPHAVLEAVLFSQDE